MCRAVRTYILSSADLVLCGLHKTLHQTRYRIVGTGKRFCDLKLVANSNSPPLLIVLANMSWSDIRSDVWLTRDAIPSSHVVLLAPPENIADSLSLFRLGVSAYLTDTISVDAFVKSLDIVMADGVVFPSHVMREFATLAKSTALAADEGCGPSAVEQASLPVTPPVRPMSHCDQDTPTLSDRETLILQALIQGDSNKHIARELDIAEATVKVHVKAILRKIRVRNRTQAAIWAIRNAAEPPFHARMH